MSHLPRASRVATRRAFTLVEILVVIAIVGLLASLLFSAFGAVKKSSQRATCASNLKQLGLALELYTQDHRGFYPPLTNIPRPDDSYYTWAEAVYPYLRSTKVFDCPAISYGDFRPGCPPPENIEISGIPQLVWPYGNYNLNRFGWNGGPPTNRVRFKNPSATVDVAGAYYSEGSKMMDPGGSTIYDAANIQTSGVLMWHGAGDNLLFADGHVKWMSIDEMARKGRNLWLPVGAS